MGEKGEERETKSPTHILVWHGNILVTKDTTFGLAHGNKLNILGYRHMRISVVTPKFFTLHKDTFLRNRRQIGVNSETSKNAQRKTLGSCFY